MSEYHKIQSLYKRDLHSKHILEGDYSLPEFEYLAENKWHFTEKVDGTNIRIICENGEVRFGGKTDNAQIPTKLLSRLQDCFLSPSGKVNLLAKIPSGILYGEGYGAGIQSGGLYRKDQDFVLFDVNIEGWWLRYADLQDIASCIGIDVVPVVGMGTLDDMTKMVKDGFLSNWGSFNAEGIVARPMIELKNRRGDRIITKLKFKDFKTVKKELTKNVEG